MAAPKEIIQKVREAPQADAHGTDVRMQRRSLPESEFELRLPIPSCVEVRTEAPDGAEGTVRKALSWAGKVHSGLWARGDLGETVQVRGKRVLWSWSAARMTTYQMLKFTRVSRPGRDINLPDRKVEKPAQFDPATGTLRPLREDGTPAGEERPLFPDDALDGEDSGIVVGSEQVQPCPHCTDGTKTCGGCHGSGMKDCPRCRPQKWGRHKMDCPECHGSKRVRGRRGDWINCRTCGGKGWRRCEVRHVEHGKIACPDCDGDGRLRCRACGGSTNVVSGLKVLATRKCLKRFGAAVHPELVSLVHLLGQSSSMGFNDGARLDALDDPSPLGAFIASGPTSTDSAAGLSDILEPALLELVMRNPVWLLPAHWELMSVPHGLRLEGNSETSPLGWLCWVRTLLGKPAPGLEMPARIGLTPDVEKALASCLQPAGEAQSGSAVVGDRLLLFGRAWLVAECELDGEEHAVFVGRRGVFAPSGSPLSREPDRRLAEAVQLAAAGSTPERVVSAVEGALTSAPFLFPQPEHLSAFLEGVPSWSVRSATKLRVLSVLQQCAWRAENEWPREWTLRARGFTSALVKRAQTRVLRQIRLWRAAIITPVVLSLLAALVFFWPSIVEIAEQKWAALAALVAEGHVLRSGEKRPSPGASGAGTGVSDATGQRQDAVPGRGAGGGPAKGAAVLNEVSEEEAESVLQQWLRAQNSGDFDTYSTLYAREFKGVKRSGRSIRTMGYSEWLADRERLFGGHVHVTAESPCFSPAGESLSVRFVQDWSSPRYRDRGVKRMLFRRSGGRVVIVEEVMETSEVLRSGVRQKEN